MYNSDLTYKTSYSFKINEDFVDYSTFVYPSMVKNDINSRVIEDEMTFVKIG